MGSPTTSAAPVMTISIAGGADIGQNLTKFEWASFVNGGYIIRAKVSDPFFNYLKNLAVKGYLKEGRSKETPVKFKIAWSGGNETKQRLAFMTDLQAHGFNEGGEIEFVAIDPPSFYLNEGTADGRVYEGRISDVIRQVVQEYAPGIKVDVTKTLDNETNKWWMMRQDPHTFIRSLLDHAAGVTPKRTSWIVSSVDEEINIKEQADLIGQDFGIYYINRHGDAPGDALQFDMLADNFVSPLQTKLITSGISAISGEYLDKITDSGQNKVFVKDENTSNKVNTNITPKQGFAKPNKKWATSVMAIPEHSAGDLGIQYSKYIDGRARGLFMNMLNLVMRVRVRVTGEPLLHDSSDLGVSTVTLTWQDIDGEPYFLSGRWLIYGFHHTVTHEHWFTDLYLARLDYNADSKKV
jgi:hypothetical protein